MGDACFFDEACLRKPEPGELMSPWIRVTFKKNNRSITVGNNSYSPENTACIKDFEFGHSNGLECRLVIHDEQGGAFAGFMDDLVKDLRCVKGNADNMEVQFGWTTSRCGVESEATSSPKYKMMCRDLNCNFAGGKFMYELTGVDISEMMFQTKDSQIYAGDKNSKIYLTDAIEKLMKDDSFTPSITSVRFQKNKPLGCKAADDYLQSSASSNSVVAIPLQFKTTDGADIHPLKGPLGTWSCVSQNKIQAALSWLAPYVSSDDKAIVPYYNSENPSEIIFWEDFKPNCNEVGRNWAAFSHGTYIVNGGKDSPVIEFNPKFKWNWSSLTNPGGNSGEQTPLANENGGKQPDTPECKTINRKSMPTAGSTTTAAADETAVETYDKGRANDKAAIGQAKQQKALKMYHLPIEADLVVMGEPRAMRPVNGLFRNIHIVFINPYFIRGGFTDMETDEVDCGDWLADPICNDVLSNRAWLVRSVTHRISEGKFSTTFGVYLVTPGIDIDIDEPLGGVGSGGWKPTPNLNC